MPPAAVAAVSIISSVAGFAMQGYSQSQMANYQAQVARNNQIIAQQNANIALQQGQQAEETQRIKTGRMIGALEAQQGASGVELGTGSPLNVEKSAAETGELDALTIRYNANLQARNYMYQSQMLGAQAGLYSSEADWAVMNSILGGASSVSSKWLWMQNAGIFGGNQPFNPASGP
jgi:hypothetical protein